MPPAQNVPTLQATQVTGMVCVPAAVCRKPAAQLPTGWHMLELLVLLYVPFAHAAQL